MPPTIFRGPNYITNWLKGEIESPTDFSRDAITVVGGTDLVSGQVISKITASGKWVALNTAGSDGSQNALGIALLDLDADTSTDQEIAAIVRDAVVIDAGLTWPVGITDMQKATAQAQLIAVGIIFRPSA